jgi:hypothetical protein
MTFIQTEDSLILGLFRGRGVVCNDFHLPLGRVD